MQRFRQATALAALVMAIVALPVLASASPIVAGFNSNTFPGNDDGSVPGVALGFSFDFYGTTYSTTNVNNNGNITFGATLGTYTPSTLTTGGYPPIIAPFFADVDTRAGNVVTYGTGTYGGQDAFGVNWLGVGYYGLHTDKLNNFQLILVDRSDIAAGDADFYFNYGSMLWETGDASGGSNGFGGACAHVGYTNGTGLPGTNYEVPGSGVCGALIDGGSNALSRASNDGVPGQYLFQVRNGAVVNPNPVPEPGTMLLLGTGFVAAYRRTRRAR